MTCLLQGSVPPPELTAHKSDSYHLLRGRFYGVTAAQAGIQTFKAFDKTGFLPRAGMTPWGPGLLPRAGMASGAIRLKGYQNSSYYLKHGRSRIFKFMVQEKHGKVSGFLRALFDLVGSKEKQGDNVLAGLMG